MGVDPQVIGRMQGSTEDYGGPLHTEPRFEQARRPRYTTDEWWRFKASAEEADDVDGVLVQLHDQSLTAEIHRFCQCNILSIKYAEDIWKIEEHMWEVGMMRDVSICRLEGANALARIEERWRQAEVQIQRLRHAAMQAEASQGA
jgi:hypothetical protein